MRATLIKLRALSYEHLFFLMLGLILVAVSIIIPSLGASRYASPDEAAVAITAERFAVVAWPRIIQPLATAYPWVHPRSWVSQGGALVPVGFLGWPLLLAPWVAIFGPRALPWLGWFVLLSTVYPLFRLLRSHFSLRASLVGLLVTFASPLFLLYANRGLFPNTGFIAAALWGLWALSRARRGARHALLAGLCIGAALIIRPVESLWFLPWCLVGWFGVTPSQERSRSSLAGWGVGGIMLMLCAFFFVNASVYGHWWSIGYWLRDNAVQHLDLEVQPIVHVHLLPFGVHPKNILWNLRSFFWGFLAPTWGILGAAFFLYFRAHKVSFRDALLKVHPCIWASLWTVFVLLVIYGSGLYQDHVQIGAVTLANSFLRYMLPLAPLAGLAAAYLFDHTPSVYAARGFVYAALLFLIAFAVFTTCFKDDESLFQTRRELRRYIEIERRTQTLFPRGGIVLSERSDKIFSESFMAVSPLPPQSEIIRLVKDENVHVPVALYLRPLSQRDRDAWRAEGIDLIDLQSFGREHLFQLSVR